MARRTRRNTKSVYERIDETLTLISEREKELAELRELLEDLYAEKDDLEMRETWSKINSIGLNMDDINKLLSDDVLSQLKLLNQQNNDANNNTKTSSNKAKKQSKVLDSIENDADYLQEELAL